MSDDAINISGPVVVGADGSSNATRAMAVAAWLATATGGELVVIHALGLTTILDGEHVPTEGNEAAVERQLVERWCAPLADRDDLEWRAELRYGSPPDALLAAVEEVGASLVVVGTRGLREDSERLLGSTSHHVVHRAGCPVVVVPPAPHG
jgi:nucleotide-binding universal stress UspA family protein